MTTQRRFPAEETLPPPARIASQHHTTSEEQPANYAILSRNCKEHTIATHDGNGTHKMDKSRRKQTDSTRHTTHDIDAALDVVAYDTACRIDQQQQQQQQQHQRHLNARRYPDTRLSARGSESECSVSSGYSGSMNGSSATPSTGGNMINHTSGVKVAGSRRRQRRRHHLPQEVITGNLVHNQNHHECCANDHHAMAAAASASLDIPMAAASTLPLATHQHGNLTSNGGKKKKKKHRKNKMATSMRNNDSDIHYADETMQHAELYERFHDDRYQYQMQAYDSHYDYDLWSNDTYDNRQKIREFWLQLGEEERRALVKVEKEAVLQKLKEQQKRNCSCSFCGRKRTAIEEELEILYDAYYEELEQYANQQQQQQQQQQQKQHQQLRFRNESSEPSDTWSDEELLAKHTCTNTANASRTKQTFSPSSSSSSTQKVTKQTLNEDNTEPNHTDASTLISDIHQAQSCNQDDDLHDNAIHVELDDRDTCIDEHVRHELDHHHHHHHHHHHNGNEAIDDHVDASDDEVNINLYYDHHDQSHIDGISRDRMADIRSSYFNFGSSLTVKGGILTVADDLLQNDGKKFLDMMERLAERRLQQEDDIAYEQEEVYEEEEEYDDEEYEDEDLDEDPLTEEQRMEEGRKMFQTFAARLFEQRVLTAYREKVARERQEQLLQEIEEEERQKQEKEQKKQRDKERKKDRKRQLKQQREEERQQQEAKKRAEEEERRKEEQRRKEEERRRQEQERQRREEEKRAREEEKRRKEEEKRRQEKERERERQLKTATATSKKKKKESEDKPKKEAITNNNGKDRSISTNKASTTSDNTKSLKPDTESTTTTTTTSKVTTAISSPAKSVKPTKKQQPQQQSVTESIPPTSTSNETGHLPDNSTSTCAPITTIHSVTTHPSTTPLLSPSMIATHSPLVTLLSQASAVSSIPTHTEIIPPLTSPIAGILPVSPHASLLPFVAAAAAPPVHHTPTILDQPPVFPLQLGTGLLPAASTSPIQSRSMSPVPDIRKVGIIGSGVSRHHGSSETTSSASIPESRPLLVSSSSASSSSRMAEQRSQSEETTIRRTLAISTNESNTTTSLLSPSDNKDPFMESTLSAPLTTTGDSLFSNTLFASNRDQGQLLGRRHSFSNEGEHHRQNNWRQHSYQTTAVQSSTATTTFDPFSTGMPIHSTLTPPMGPSQLYHTSNNNNTIDWLPTVLNTAASAITTSTNTTSIPASTNTNILPISVMNPVMGQMNSYNSNTDIYLSIRERAVAVYFKLETARAYQTGMRMDYLPFGALYAAYLEMFPGFPCSQRDLYHACTYRQPSASALPPSMDGAPPNRMGLSDISRGQFAFRSHPTQPDLLLTRFEPETITPGGTSISLYGQPSNTSTTTPQLHAHHQLHQSYQQQQQQQQYHHHQLHQSTMMHPSMATNTATNTTSNIVDGWPSYLTMPPGANTQGIWRTTTTHVENGNDSNSSNTNNNANNSGNSSNSTSNPSLLMNNHYMGSIS